MPNFGVVSFDLIITKTSVDPNTGERKIRMSASDTGWDAFDERMSLELFNNFIARIKSKNIPAVFKSAIKEKSGWDGGMPYASISHYKSGIDGKNIPADIISVYVDGRVLKSVAVVRDNALGNALWKSLMDDKAGTSKFTDKIRVSIGFIDLKHSHGNFVFERDTLVKECPLCKNNSGDKTYLDGILVHEAFTRKPANPRTDVEVLRMSEILTREQDASSIVGELAAQELEVNKSVIDDALVEKAAPVEDSPKDEEMEGEHPTGCECESCAAKKKKSVVEEPVAVKTEIVKTELEVAFDALVAGIEQNKSLPKEEALRAIQTQFDALGAAVQKSFPDPVQNEIQKSDPGIGILLEELRSVVGAVSSLQAEIKTLSGEVAIMKSQATIQSQGTKQAAPTPRTVQVERSQANQLEEGFARLQSGKGLSIHQLVEKTTF